ncbi:Clp protease N-terminal domain-containing protein [Cellulomonas chengniuliangii]|uniref:Clp R domain-containing protein n=1 Tax=Cellulomonas chengniuliangii TaxID=2968084 RepID=A0ABY5L176_9CELL|nr:Clp protease N-terminal domain-containing protein [Cellulomonas chengniuliangii]MCC2308882.1 hypothetical protein [Cellulomonas chengniuliangii]MCC2317109.1 hypothetical protein [Cellulomonas chengniuliangii]UUI74378.1 hypothetical protein NP064_11255 [Cellulomonas chengniuliangii]
MFERFTQDARQVVIRAREEATALRHDRIGTEHLLLGLFGQQGSPTVAVLARHGLTREGVVESLVSEVGDGLDAGALSALGIDLDAVRDKAEGAFGPGALDGDERPARSGMGGHVPFNADAKKALELALREAIALKQRSITDGHIALGVLREGRGLATTVLVARGVDTAALGNDLTQTLLA